MLSFSKNIVPEGLPALPSYLGELHHLLRSPRSAGLGTRARNAIQNKCQRGGVFSFKDSRQSLLTGF